MNICIASKNKLKRGALQYFIYITEGTSTFSSDAPFIFKNKQNSTIYFIKQTVRTSARSTGARWVTGTSL